jgi:fatty acid amide hydrolase 2
LDEMTRDRKDLEKNLAELKALKDFLTRKLGKNSVLLMPVHPRKAPLLNATYTRPFDFAMTGIINALGFPATAVPMGISAEGLPLSLQIVAAEDQDHLCLSVAQMLETGFGGYQAPSSC